VCYGAKKAFNSRILKAECEKKFKKSRKLIKKIENKKIDFIYTPGAWVKGQNDYDSSYVPGSLPESKTREIKNLLKSN